MSDAVLAGESSYGPVVEVRRHAHDTVTGPQDVFQGQGFVNILTLFAHGSSG